MIGSLALVVIIVLRFVRVDHGVFSKYAKSSGRPFLIFGLVYGGGLIGLKYLISFAQLEDRILAPLYAPLIAWVCYSTWIAVQEIGSVQTRIVVRIALVSVFLFWAGRSALVLPRYLDAAHANQMPLSLRSMDRLGHNHGALS